MWEFIFFLKLFIKMDKSYEMHQLLITLIIYETKLLLYKPPLMKIMLCYNLTKNTIFIFSVVCTETKW